METTVTAPTTRAPVEPAPASPVTFTAKAVEMVKEAMTRENLAGRSG